MALPARGVVILYRGPHPIFAYPAWPRDEPSAAAGSVVTAPLPGTGLLMRSSDRRELLRRVSPASIEVQRRGPPPGGDRDGDGIPDRLDLVIGAHKTAINAARYGAGYIRLGFPGGDVPRDVGVCTDVVIRAARNAGIDLQRDLHRDIARSRRSYPMVKTRNPHIDHRRVKTLLPYFRRHWDRRASEPGQAGDPYLPGDVVFMDTMPSRSGPDHIGIISDRAGDSGLPLVINNWTDGFHTQEMDLLGWVRVTHRFRLR